MPTQAQFFRYCPTDTVASNVTDVVAFTAYVLSNSAASVKTDLDRYLDLDGRAAEASMLNLASYLADSAAQPLYALSADMTASYAVIGSTEPVGLGGFFDLHGYISLGVADTSGLRVASSGSIPLLRHFYAGTRVLVQVEGDTVSEIECVVTTVDSTTMKLTGPVSPDLEILVTAIFMSDHERAIDVVTFRQFTRFSSTTSAADESSFNPSLYVLLYRAIRPDIVGMTASQLYDDYAMHPGSAGSLADLRRLLDTPTISSLSIANLIDIEPGAAIRLEGVLVRTIATLNDVLNDLPDARSDLALITAGATREMVDASIRDLNQTVTSESITASLAVTLPGSFTADLDGFRVDVPMQISGLQAADILTDGLDSRVVRTDGLSATRCDFGEVQATGIATEDIRTHTAQVDDLSAGSVAATSAAFDGDLRAGNTTVASLQAGPTRTESLDTGNIVSSAVSTGTIECGDVRSSGSATFPRGIECSDLSATGSVSAGGGAVVADSAVFRVSVPSEFTDIDADRVQAGAVISLSADVRSLVAGAARFNTIESDGVTTTDLRVARVVDGLRVLGASVIEALRASDVVVDTISTTTAEVRDLTVTQVADVAELVVRHDAVIDRVCSARRFVSEQLDVTGQAGIKDLAVTGLTLLQTLNVVTNVGVAGNITLAGTLDAGPTRIRGNLTLMGDIAAQRVISDGDLYSEYGNLRLTRGSAYVYADAVIGGATAIGGDVAIKGNVELSRDLRVIGTISTDSDFSAANATFTGGLTAGDASLGDVDCMSVRAEDARISGRAVIGGDVGIEGGVSVSAEGRFGGNVTAGDATFRGAVDVGSNAAVGGSLRVDQDAAVHGGLSVDGDANIIGKLGVEGGVACVGTIETIDLMASSDVVAEGKVSVGQTLEVAGRTMMEDDLDVDGAVTAEYLIVRADADVTGSIQVSRDAIVAGSVSAGADLDVAGSARVEGDVIVDGALASGKLDVNGDVSILGDVRSTAMRARSLESDDLKAGCLQVTPRGVEVDGQLDCSSTHVHGPVIVEGPMALNSTIDFGTIPTVFKAQVNMPYLASDAVTSQQVHVRRIVIGPATDFIIGTFGDPTPSSMQGRITALEGQLALMTAQIAALTQQLLGQ